MTSAVQLALTLGPLALYLYLVAIWQSGRRPRVIAGPIDFVLLLVGVSGVVVFGPVGWLLMGRMVPRGVLGIWAVLAIVSALGLLALPWLHRSFRRVVVYNVDSNELHRAIREVLHDLPGSFSPTLQGYEDRENGRGLKVENTPWFRAGMVEAYGRDPEILIGLMRTGLRATLRSPSERPTAVAWLLLGLCLGLLSPVLIILLSRAQTREVLRVLIERIHGG